MDDWEYSDKNCPKCSSQLATRRCHSCGGDGFVELDDEDEWELTERCDNCSGQGHETWCRECGWDMNFKCFLSEQYEQEWTAKQARAAGGVSDTQEGAELLADLQRERIPA